MYRTEDKCVVVVVVVVIVLAVVDHNRLIFLPGVIAATATIRSLDVPLIIFFVEKFVETIPSFLPL